MLIITPVLPPCSARKKQRSDTPQPHFIPSYCLQYEGEGPITRSKPTRNDASAETGVVRDRAQPSRDTVRKRVEAAINGTQIEEDTAPFDIRTPQATAAESVKEAKEVAQNTGEASKETTEVAKKAAQQTEVSKTVFEAAKDVVQEETPKASTQRSSGANASRFLLWHSTQQA